jgi:geranylgeranyl diphosphate synthase type II
MSETSLVNQDNSHQLLQQCETTMRAAVAHNDVALFHLTSGGGRTRARLCIDSGLVLRLEPQTIISIAGAIELLHNASLVHDDLQDSDERRRGDQSTWKKYGKGHAICAGDLMISAAYSLLAQASIRDRHALLFSTMHRAVAKTVEGQHLDISAMNEPDESKYEHIAALKSGPLIQLTLTLPLIAAGYKDNVSLADTALAQFAVAYQILDDLDDWQQDFNKGQLNMVNITATKSTHEQAIYLARSRAQYLLKQCQKSLMKMPHQCAASMIEAAKAMQHKVNVNTLDTNAEVVN